MDFFGAQDRAHRNSRSLLLFFVLGVGALICAVYLAVVFSLGLASRGTFTGNPALFLVVAVGMILMIGGGSAFRSGQLRRGGGVVARMMGGRRVAADTSDPAEQRYRNVVEEMAIASGVAVPEIYVLDGESGINAFAAGHTQADAAIAVTRGALEQLDRDELQGVVAHEFSHILNGDMRLNLRLIGILFGIFLLTVTGRGILRGSRHRRGKGNAQIVLLAVAFVILGYIGVLVGRLIQAAVSRQREFLADASAVQFTRNPDGIAGALRRIGGGPGSKIASHHAQEVAHLFFANGLGTAFSRAFATHPPLEERIRRLDPRAGYAGAGGSAGSARTPGAGSPLSGAAGISGLSPAPGTPLVATPLTATAGLVDASRIDAARDLLNGIPAEMREAARAPEGGVPLLLGLLLASCGDPRDRALEVIARTLSPDTARNAEARAAEIEALGPEVRLPLLDLILAGLHTLPRTTAGTLPGAVREVILLDARILPFEFALYHLLRRHLAAGEARRRPVPHGNVRRLRAPIEVVLTALARSGAGSGPGGESRNGGDGGQEPAAGAAGVDGEAGAGRAAAAMAAGLKIAGLDGRLLPAEAAGLIEVDAALVQLEGANAQLRRKVIDAAQAIVVADRRIEFAEAELLRAFAAALDIPIPPVQVGATA